MNKLKHLIVVFSVLLLSASATRASVKVASLFTDHMVLQQGMSVPVWGTAANGEKITVTVGPQTQSTTAGADGTWMVHLSPLSAGGPFAMTVTASNTLALHDLYAGEVWLASGQSNMEMTVAQEDRYWCGVMNEEEEIATANYPLIRTFKVKLKTMEDPQTAAEGQWVVASPETVKKFSAAGYFFGRELYRKFKVPIGLIDSTYGGSAAQAWISRPALAAKSDLTFLLDAYTKARQDYSADGAAKEKYQEAMKAWEQAAAVARAQGTPTSRQPKNPDPGQDQHSPYVLYNAMIAPLVPYALRGAIWYQGESNGPTAKHYFTIMETLISDWRTRWGQGNFPFLFVQLANYGTLALQPGNGGGTTWVREGQLKTLTVPNTGMAVTIDVGDAGNIHPKNKQEVGRRLALVARALVYHEPIPYSGPLYDSMAVEGGAIRLHFKHADDGIVAKGGTPIGFAIAGEDRRFVWGNAKIEGESIVVSSPEIAKPAAVRYGWADNPPVNLYNKADLPASPFRTDSW